VYFYDTLQSSVQEKIVDTSFNLFKSLGFRAVTVEYLCAQLRISKKTFYQYFENKEEVVDLVVSNMISQIMDECREAIQDSSNAIDEIFLSLAFANKDLQDMNPIFLHDLSKYHNESYDKFMVHFHEFHHDVIEKNIRRGVQEGLYRDGLNIEILTKFRLHTIFMCFDQNIFPKEKFNLLDVTHQLLENFLFGIATKEGFNTIQEYKKKYKDTL
jgi:TetR/AcrR family transcriptional regulator, cholesterol catabolism regulator